MWHRPGPGTGERPPRGAQKLELERGVFTLVRDLDAGGGGGTNVKADAFLMFNSVKIFRSLGRK